MLGYMFAIMLLLKPEELPDAVRAAAISEDSDAVYLDSRIPADKEAKMAIIKSKRSDFDRAEGVAMFEGNVFVEYDRDYTLHSDQLFVFAAGTNRLNRIVAIGNVMITNEMRVGTCQVAVFRRLSSEIEMFGDGKSAHAKLLDISGSRDAVEGSKIKFCLDSEQVTVDDAVISVGTKKGSNLL